MKKFVVLSSIAFLILAFGATVYGQEQAPALQFKASGFFDMITEYNRNVPQPGAGTSATGGTSTNDVVYGAPPSYWMPTADGVPDKAFDRPNAFIEGRGRLRFDAIMGKEMMGTFQFEFDSTRWGERIPAGSTAQRNYSGFWGVADRASLELKHMYMTFGMPWIPIQTVIQAGIQPIGIRPSIFMSTDGPAITAAMKIDPLWIKLIYAKALEGKDWAADDDNVYALETNVRAGTFTIGGYYALFNWNSYPAAAGEGSACADAKACDPTSKASPAVQASAYTSNASWVGLYMDGKAGPVLLNFDIAYDWGNIKDRSDVKAVKADKVKLSGWGAILNVGFPWEKFLFGFQGLYGSGADQQETAGKSLPGAATPWGTVSTKNSAFLVPGGTEASNTHALVVDGGGINRGNTGFEPAADYHSRSGFGGLWIAKLYGAFQVSPIFNTRLELMYIGDTTKNGDTIGNAKDTSGNPEDNNQVGIEVDWLNSLSLYKNLTWQFGVGYLFGGDALNYAVIGAANGTNKKPKDPFVITTNLTYSF
jgi:hypothetical protein